MKELYGMKKLKLQFRCEEYYKITQVAESQVMPSQNILLILPLIVPGLYESPLLLKGRGVGRSHRDY